MSVAAYDDLLTHELVVLGRIMPASNHTFLAALGAREYAARLVSERTGWGVVPPHPSGRLFADLLGRTNQALARVSDEVLLVVMGRVVTL